MTVAFVYTPRTGRLAVTRVPVGAGTLARAAAALDRAFNGAPHDFPPLAPLPARRPWKRDLGFLAETAGELLGFLPEVAGSEHLCLSPDGPLHGLPLHALPLSDGTCLGQRHAVTYVPTASALGYLVARRTAAPRPQSIFCAGVAAREDPDPAALERDGDLLRAAGWAVEELSGTNAVRQAVLDALRTRRMAHLTCHGHFDAVNPLDSGLLLADGGERPSREPAALSMPQRLRHLLTVGDLAGAGIDMGSSPCAPAPPAATTRPSKRPTSRSRCSTPEREPSSRPCGTSTGPARDASWSRSTAGWRSGRTSRCGVASGTRSVR